MKAVLPLPAGDKLLAVLGNDGRAALLNEADEITSGKVRLFGGEPVELKLSVPGTLRHWTAYETGKEPIPYALLPVPDIKFVWEPARFGWAFTLGRAYRLSGDEKYAEAFWRYFESFTDANPACFGPHWMSGQEVALRLMAFVWAGQVFEAALAHTGAQKPPGRLGGGARQSNPAHAHLCALPAKQPPADRSGWTAHGRACPARSS
jgi:hypothetical protein